MFEEEKSENEERYIKALVEEYSRRELDEIAAGLGINPNDYPNKRSIVEAIVEARKHEEVQIEEDVLEEAPIEEAIPKYPVVEEVRKKVEKVSPDTVRGKMEATKEKAAEINAAVQVFHQSVQEQMKENEAALAAFTSSVQVQMKENEDAVKKIYAFMPVFQQNIQEQMKENEDFLKQFYG